MSTVDLSERDNKETLFVKEEVTNDAEVFGEASQVKLVLSTQIQNSPPFSAWYG